MTVYTIISALTAVSIIGVLLQFKKIKKCQVKFLFDVIYLQ